MTEKEKITSLRLDDYRVDVDLPKVKDYLVKGKTLQKICEDLGYTDHVVRYYLGGSDIKTVINIEDKIAVNNGFNSRKDLDNYVMRCYLKDMCINKVANTLYNISNSTCQRIIERIVRERLKVSDFE